MAATVEKTAMANGDENAEQEEGQEEEGGAEGDEGEDQDGGEASGEGGEETSQIVPAQVRCLRACAGSMLRTWR